MMMRKFQKPHYQKIITAYFASSQNTPNPGSDFPFCGIFYALFAKNRDSFFMNCLFQHRLGNPGPYYGQKCVSLISFGRMIGFTTVLPS
jgi:hypothetical protein